MMVSALEYGRLRMRFFGESPADAIAHVRELGRWARPELGLDNAEVLRRAAQALLTVDAANAKWIAL